jgi:Tol biopolymer transport system component
VWRLGVDGQTPQQFSDEPAGVDYFDVSRADGRVAVVSGNRLLLLSADANERSVLVDTSGNDPEALDYRFRGVISEPRFSPDGSTLAYGLGGVNLLDLDSGESRLVLASNVDESDSGAVTPGELFFPEAWSPDGERLLVTIGFLEGGSLGVLDAESGEFAALQAQGILCCHPVWAPDSQSVVVASPYYGIITPGLWRYAADTGTQRVLAPGVDATESYHFFGWPLDTGNELFYFYASSAGFPDGTLPLRMARSDTDGVRNRAELSEEGFSIREALWAEDGSLALIVEAAEEGSGPLLLVIPGEGQVQVLSPEAEHLRWGP